MQCIVLSTASLVLNVTTLVALQQLCINNTKLFSSIYFIPRIRKTISYSFLYSRFPDSLRPRSKTKNSKWYILCLPLSLTRPNIREALWFRIWGQPKQRIFRVLDYLYTNSYLHYNTRFIIFLQKAALCTTVTEKIFLLAILYELFLLVWPTSEFLQITAQFVSSWVQNLKHNLNLFLFFNAIQSHCFIFTKPIAPWIKNICFLHPLPGSLLFCTASCLACGCPSEQPLIQIISSGHKTFDLFKFQ